MRRLVATVALAAAICGHAQSTNTASIIANTADLSCLNYRVVGECFWRYWVEECEPIAEPPFVSCSLVPKVRTSVKVAHWIPDLIVTSYAAKSQHPWTELGALDLWAASGGISDDGATMGRGAGDRGSTGLRFKMTEVLGSPGLAWIETISSLGIATDMVCPATAEAMDVHYVSRIDPAWREDVLQGPLTLLNTLRGLQEPGFPRTGGEWAPMYPRGGLVQNDQDYKAAAVAALRSVDIVTRPGPSVTQPHVYEPLLYPGGGAGYWPPTGPVDETDLEHRWQLLSPTVTGCERFASRSSLADLLVDRLGGRQARNGAYVWNLWRPYACCEDRGDFIEDINF